MSEREPRDRQVVRLSTNYWKDERGGLHLSKSLRTLKRKSEGYQIATEDAYMAGVDEVMQHIENLFDCEDGVYEIVTCNESTDWETGHVDSYDYKLLPFREASRE